MLQSIQFLTIYSVAAILVPSGSASAFVTAFMTSQKMVNLDPAAFTMATGARRRRRSNKVNASGMSAESCARLDQFKLHAHEFDGELEVQRTYAVNDDSDADTDADSSASASPSSATTSMHKVHYYIRNRMNLSSQQAAPILVLHGGPGVPCDYLLPLQDLVPYR